MAAEVVGSGGSQLLQRLSRASDRVEGIRTVLDRADRVIARPIHGQDGEGAVELVLGAHGATDAVHLDPDWRDLVGEHGVRAAATEAYHAAHGSRLSDWAGVIRESLSASGQVPLSPRADRADSGGIPAIIGPEPDLRALATDRPDADVAAELRAALNRAGTAAGPAVEGVDAALEATTGAQVRGRVGEAFTAVTAAVVAAPRWLSITLVVSGAQHVVGTLREVTEELLDFRSDETGEPERSPRGQVDAGTADGALVRALEAAAARARFLLSIPEGLEMVVTAVEEFVAHLRSSAEAAEGSRHAQVG